MVNQYIRAISRRMTNSQLEDTINMLEEERKRRNLLRDDEINNDKARLKGINRN